MLAPVRQTQITTITSQSQLILISAKIARTVQQIGAANNATQKIIISIWFMLPREES